LIYGQLFFQNKSNRGPYMKMLDGFTLDKNNKEFFQAYDLVNNTSGNIFLTGKAGTGKTTFLKYLSENTHKNHAITAYTGVAAVNAGGTTLNSFFQIAPSVYIHDDPRLRTKPDPGDEDKSTIYDHFEYRQDKRELIENLKLLIIDEVSMVRCDMIDVVDRLLRVYRKKDKIPFGGVQLLLIGDVFQIPPIARQDEWDILKQFYRSPFFFSSNSIRQLINHNELESIELKKIYRQSEERFIQLLNRLRINDLTSEDLQLLNSRYDPCCSVNSKDGYISLGTHRKSVDFINQIKLQDIEKPMFQYNCIKTGDFPKENCPTEEVLELKEGAQVMFITNDWGYNRRYYNGSIGKVTNLEKRKIMVGLQDNGELINVEQFKWRNIRYRWDKEKKKVIEEEIGSFTQYPLKLAWAITVHKCQGLTFTNVIADLSKSWDSGQVYVGLSRCATFQGLILKSRISRECIKVNRYAVRFINYLLGS